MYDKYGKTKLWTWFFAFLTMFIIAFVLICQVGFTVDAEESYSTFPVNFRSSVNGHNVDDKCLNTTFYSTANVGSLSLVDLIPSEGTKLKACFQHDQFKVPTTFQFNNGGDIQTLNTFDCFDAFYIINSGLSNEYIVVLYNKSVGQGTKIINNYLYRVVVNRAAFEQLPTAEKAKYYTFSYSARFNDDGTMDILDASGVPWADHDVVSPNGLDGRTIMSFMIFNNSPSSGGRILMCSDSLYQSLGNSAFNPWYYYGLAQPQEGESYDSSLSEDYNYLLGGSGNDSGGDFSNNMYTQDGDWIFQNTKFSAPYSVTFPVTNDNYPTGTVMYTFTPNNFQITHASDYKLRFSFYFDVTLNYQWQYNTDSPPFYKTSALTNNWKKLVQHYTMDYIDVPLSDFITSGNAKSWTFKELYNSLMCDGQSLNSLMAQCRELTSGSYDIYYINATAQLVVGNTPSENKYSESYNPMTKESNVTNDTLNNNDNPYVDNSSNSDPESGTNSPTENTTPGPAGNSSSSINSGNIVINNNFNPTNNGSGSGIPTTITQEESSVLKDFWNYFNPVKRMFNALTDKNSNLGDTIVENFGVNNWLMIITATFTFMPAAFWLSIASYVSTTFKILIVGFIIRIVLDLL